MRQTTLPNLKNFLMNKTDLYIMNGMHAEINYDVVVIPNSLHFFRIIAVPFGVCNISTEALDREIFNDLKQNPAFRAKLTIMIDSLLTEFK